MITDALGRVVIARQIAVIPGQQNSVTVDVNRLGKGLYFVQVTFAQKRGPAKKLIV